MAEYIEREAAIGMAVSGMIRTLPTTESGEDWIRVEEVRESLKRTPAADVRHVVRGKWLERKLPTVDPRDYFCRMALCCSICGHEIDYGRGYGPNYCGNCGADMRGLKSPAEEG